MRTTQRKTPSKSPKIALKIPNCTQIYEHSFEIPKSVDKPARERKPSGSIKSVVIPKRRRKPSGSIKSVAIPKRKMRLSAHCDIKPISGFIEKVVT